ncbi:MAG: amidohydrolase family protein [Desulfobacterales bacterium]|nr:amidohydrolase family protein [Desulfobacterales bacterium]
MNDKKTPVVDIMCYLFTHENIQKCFWDAPEFRRVIEWWGLAEKTKGRSVQEFTDFLDEAGVDKVCMPAVKMKAWRENRLIWDVSVDEIYETTKKNPDRFVGFAGVNPFAGRKGVQEVEHAVKDLGFKGVYLHTYGFDIPINDKLYYPYYEKCVELGVGISMQVGHSAELMPSAHGRPIFIEDIALDFPELNIVGAHTGWPWVEEMIAMAWKFPNVYLGIDAHMPKYLDPSIVRFIKTRGKGKVVWGTNYPAIYQKEALDQIREWQLRPEVEAGLIGGTAAKIFNLDK